MVTRRRLTAQATAGLSGTAEFVFQGARNSYDLIGNVSIPGAPAAAIFTVIIGDLTELTFYGTNPAGPFLLHPNEVMKIEAAGLTNGIQYQAVWPITEVPAGSTTATPAVVGGITNANVSGTITANQGAPGTIPNSWFFELTNGVNVIGVPGAPLRVDFSGNVPVSGEITADQGTPNSNANGWPVKITDGTNVLGTGPHPLVSSISGTVGVTQSTSPWVVSGTVTANPPALPTAPIYGQTAVAVTGTAVQLPSHAITNGSDVYLSAPSSNGHVIAIGDAAVTTGNGFLLVPGAPPVPIRIDNTNRLYINGTVGDLVSFLSS